MEICCDVRVDGVSICCLGCAIMRWVKGVPLVPNETHALLERRTTCRAVRTRPVRSSSQPSTRGARCPLRLALLMQALCKVVRSARRLGLLEDDPMATAGTRLQMSEADFSEAAFPR